MKTKVLMLMAVLLSLSSCNAQDKKEKALNNNKDEQAVPKGKWKVNKKFDKNGNLISYDSTYVYSYSTVNGDTISNPNMDETMKKFRQFFESNGMGGQSALMESFFNDSLGGNEDFFRNGFFRDHVMAQDFQEQIKKMDSLHREFLKQNYPQMFYDNRQKIIPRADESQGGRS
ncbi:MAG: hypothetical protein WAM00_12770 [Salegentibacter sp.]